MEGSDRANRTGVQVMEQNVTEDGDGDTQHSVYMLFLLVLVFFVMGLVGFLICHILKKKGYRCRTFRDELEPDNKEPLTPTEDGEDEELNEDTVEKIVKCIIQNEANVEVLKEMLAEGDTDPPMPVPVPSGLCPHRISQDGGLPHHHTVHLGSAQAPCIHCIKKKRHPLHRQGRSKESKSKMHPGETTVFSVGRFHVTHIEKKLDSHGSQEESFRSSKQDLGSADTDQEIHNNEKPQWDGSQNGVVQMDGLLQGTVHQADTQSDRGANEDHVHESAQENSLSNVTADSEVSMNGPERKEYSKASLLQPAGLLGTVTGCTSETNCSAQPKSLCSEDLKKVERLDKTPDTCEDEGIEKGASEISENKGNQVFQPGSKLDISGTAITQTSNKEIQEQSSVMKDPGVSV
uniref:RELT-like protein 2 isoform X1 n=2 Tax=Pogona vitticeps TaxID=103695 RepID=A0A6J0U9G1_9SAUR